MKIKKVQSACLILACIAATGLIGCGKTDETPKKHEAITFMAPYLEVDNFIEEVHKTYPEIELEVVPYSGYRQLHRRSTTKPIRRLNWKLFRTAEQIQQPICRIC